MPSVRFKVEGQDCYDLGCWYPDAEKTDDLKMTGKQLGDFFKGLCKDFPMVLFGVHMELA